jgi:hypothetical protein
VQLSQRAPRRQLPGDDEDVTYVFQADDRDHAIEQFENAIWDGKDEDHEDRLSMEAAHGTDTFVNSVLVSATPITSP